jgi:hypothetical protein
LIIESSVEGEERIEEKFLPDDLKFTLTQRETYSSFSFEDVHKWADSMSFSSERIDTSVAKKKFGTRSTLGINRGGCVHTHTHTIVAYDPLHRSFHIPKQLSAP